MRTYVSRVSVVVIILAAITHGYLSAADKAPAVASTSEAPVDVYRARRSNIDVHNPDELLKLANWAMSQERFRRNRKLLEQVRSDLTKALEMKKKQKKDALEIELVLKQVNARISGTSGTTTIITPGGDKDILTKRDIYWIRLWELAPDDNVTIVYKNKVLDRYIEAMRGREIDNWDKQGKEQVFLKMPKSRQVMEILRNMKSNKDLLKDIYVEGDPSLMRYFQTQVWPMLRRKCTSPKCHGGQKPRGGLRFVVDTRENSLEGRYTNYAALSGLKNSKGMRLLDRKDPKMSLLLQFGLDRKISKLRHKKKITPPLFKSLNDPVYVRVHTWIKSLRGPLHPDYQIDRNILGMKPELRGKVEVSIPGLD